MSKSILTVIAKSMLTMTIIIVLGLCAILVVLFPNFHTSPQKPASSDVPNCRQLNIDFATQTLDGAIDAFRKQPPDASFTASQIVQILQEGRAGLSK